MKKCGITIIFLNRPDSKDTPEDNLLSGVQGLIAEYEKAKILERTRRGKIHKAKNGIIVSGTPPYGYRCVDGSYLIDPNEAEVVKLVFKSFTEDGMKMRSIAKELIRRNIRSRKGGFWRPNVIYKILKNETYTGITHFNKSRSFEVDNPKRHRRIKNTGREFRPREEWIPIEHKAIIIDREVFDTAQKLLRRNLTDFNAGNAKHQYLLKGLIRCGLCGSAWHGTVSKGIVYYKCGHSNYGRQCSSGWIRADRTDKMIWDKFCEIIQQPDLMLLAQKVNNFDTHGTDTEEMIKTAQTKLDNVEKEANRMVVAYRQGIVSLDILREQTTQINQKRQALEMELKKLQEMQEQAVLNDQARTSIIEYCKVISENLQGISNDFDAKRPLLTLIIEKIEIFPDHLNLYTVIPDYHISSIPSGLRVSLIYCQLQPVVPLS